jgi:hypothetical protein
LQAPPYVCEISRPHIGPDGCCSISSSICDRSLTMERPQIWLMATLMLSAKAKLVKTLISRGYNVISGTP